MRGGDGNEAGFELGTTSRSPTGPLYCRGGGLLMLPAGAQRHVDSFTGSSGGSTHRFVLSRPPPAWAASNSCKPLAHVATCSQVLFTVSCSPHD